MLISFKSKALKDANGVLVTDPDAIEAMFLDHFCSLFRCEEGSSVSRRGYSYSGNGVREETRASPSLLAPIKTDRQRKDLDQPITPDEIRKAMFQMDGRKAPGPDGFVAAFYQGKLGLVLTKVLVNRLRLVLGDLISQYQNGFVPARMISDNVLIAHEMLEFIRQRKREKQRFLPTMGFSQKWVRWIHQCISTVSFSVVVNGRRSRPFIPACGLRQGDPLSPYLFILVAQAFSDGLEEFASYDICRGWMWWPGSVKDQKVQLRHLGNESTPEVHGLTDDTCAANVEYRQELVVGRTVGHEKDWRARLSGVD
ncbi:hypothetical protein RHSIM_Rhsim03G0099900 [Rhododendron simsii]|uniref:Reverse transcriptase domain-containing protein n=1 Tax=Rhododendron simsii TaxID=118357 RepID=A0A834H6B3_RHOSS|nr:hypothetical protein RHSIM_Rhsim03G0099900 [Rhododendron simsii]